MLIFLDQNDIKFIESNYINPTSILKIIKYLKEAKKTVIGDYLLPIKLDTEITFNHRVTKTKFIVGAIGDKWDLNKSIGFTPINTSIRLIDHSEKGVYNFSINNTFLFDHQDHIGQMSYKYIFAFPIIPIPHKSFVFSLNTF